MKYGFLNLLTCSLFEALVDDPVETRDQPRTCIGAILFAILLSRCTVYIMAYPSKIGRRSAGGYFCWQRQLNERSASASHPREQMDITVKRLGLNDQPDARRLFAMLAEAFEESCAPLSDRYLDQLICRSDFWAMAAFVNAAIIGGVTAYTLPMTKQESSEIFIYDVAVLSAYRRKGVGRRLLTELQNQASEAGIHELFVAADNDDEHALDFYRHLGGNPTLTTMFGLSKG
jgi:aminoglycoside 3-N-acetyltransferase I